MNTITLRLILGTLIKIGENSDKSPIYRKKPWRMSDFANEERVSFYAPWEAPVTIQGVTLQIKAGDNENIPVSFRNVYRERMKIQHADYASLLPAPSPNAVSLAASWASVFACKSRQ